MDNKIILFASLLISTVLSGQDYSNQKWENNFIEAKIKAHNESKEILLLFSGSDWCVPCIRLKKEILTTPEFENFSKDHFIIVNIDFPKKEKNKEKQSLFTKSQNINLAKRYNPEGYFPRILIFDEHHNIKADIGYKPISPNEYIKLIESKL